MRKALLGLILVACLASVRLWAQDTASIVGTVADPTGAVIPNAKVRVENPLKGFVRELTTNAAGAFAVAPLPLGDYTVTVEATGFQKDVESGITLTAGQIQRVDVALKVGASTQDVSVVGNVPHVQTETGAIPV